jgi:hypothetical protein
LFEDYCLAPGAADRRYKGKVLELTGHVARTNVDAGGTFFVFAVVRPHRGVERIEDTWRRVAAASASGVEGVKVYLSEKSAPVTRGKSVTVRAVCEGMPLNVELREGEVQ